MATSQPEPTFTVVPTGEYICCFFISCTILLICVFKVKTFKCFSAVVCLKSCSFLCRSVAVDSNNQVTMLQLSHKTEILLQTSTATFLLVREVFDLIITQYLDSSLQFKYTFVSLCSIKCMQSLQKSSPLSMWTPRCSVSPLMAASLKTGTSPLKKLHCMPLITWSHREWKLQLRR